MTGERMQMGRKERGSGAGRLAVPWPSLPASLLLVLLAAPAGASSDLVLIPEASKLLILLALFGLLILPTNILIFKPIFRALDERQSRIAGARQRADQIAREADRVLQRYEEAIRTARGEADAVRKEQIQAARSEHASIAGAARQDAERTVEHAREELTRALSDARASLRATSQELARTAAERILGRSVS